MAGGKGRGMAAFSFHVENLGITRANMPDARRGPGQLFPVLEFKPVAMDLSPSDDYMLSLKQEMRGAMRRLPCYLTPNAAKSEVERYKDKYAKEKIKIKDEEWTPDWNRLPRELMPKANLPTKKKSVLKKKPKTLTSQDKDSLLSKLNELEKTDDVNADEEKEEAVGEKKKKGEDGNEEEEDKEDIEAEELDEEELEEENDYINSYFDNGDDFGAGSDDNMDEATY
ncbi:DNA-directed RNA polymerase III subunit RPC7 [Engraulis encrasicolus]|uniref:DNA-directed RNA polymerase III subunit RPC7 n=1 Tax=Engraulis encrasicolus TaxID=184585 RepID=UPI002FD43DF6